MLNIYKQRLRSEFKILKKNDQRAGTLVFLMHAFSHPIKTLADPTSQILNDVDLTEKKLKQILTATAIFLSSFVLTLSLLVKFGPNNLLTLVSSLLTDIAYFLFSMRVWRVTAVGFTVWIASSAPLLGFLSLAIKYGAVF